MLLGLFIELLPPGGVQRIGRHAAAALTSMAEEQGLRCRLLSVNDPPGRHHLEVGGIPFEFEGFEGRRTRFALATALAARRSRWAYLSHPGLAPLGVVLKAVRPSCDFWIQLHGVEAWERLPLPHRAGLRLARGITAVSRATAEQAATAQGFDPRRVTVLPPALDPEFERANATGEDPSIVPGSKIVLTVARLAASEQYKGVDTVIRALPAVLTAVPETAYVIVGDGDDRRRLEQLAAALGVSDRVCFFGSATSEQLVSQLRSCAVFAMPSRREGFGISYLEAMWFRKPVVAGNHGGTPEVVVDGETGFLVEHGRVDPLAEVLVRLLRDDGLRAEMGEAGHSRVRSTYTFATFRRRIAQLPEKSSSRRRMSVREAARV